MMVHGGGGPAKCAGVGGGEWGSGGSASLVCMGMGWGSGMDYEQQEEAPSSSTSSAAEAAPLLLRTSCDSCTQSKTRCPGGTPCPRCNRRGTPCLYSAKRRCGPKRKLSVTSKSQRSDSCAPPSDDDNDELRGGRLERQPDGAALLLLPVVLSEEESNWLSTYFATINPFIPLTSEAALRGVLGSGSPTACPGVELSSFQALRATLWAAISLGCIWRGNELHVATGYANRARAHLKECFDSAAQEILGAYTLMFFFSLHSLDRSAAMRYSRFAQLAAEEHSPLPEPLGAVIGVLRVFTFLSGTSNGTNAPKFTFMYRLMGTGHPQPTPSKESARSTALQIFGFVLMELFFTSPPAGDSAGKPALVSQDEPNPEVMALETNGQVPQHILEGLLDRAEQCLSLSGQQDDIGTCISHALRAYLLERRGSVQDAVQFAESLALILADNPCCLYFPSIWCVSNYALQLLMRQQQHATVGSLLNVILPLYAKSLTFSTRMCLLSQKLTVDPFIIPPGLPSEEGDVLPIPPPLAGRPPLCDSYAGVGFYDASAPNFNRLAGLSDEALLSVVSASAAIGGRPGEWAVA
jgi:hypothetical protein